MARLSPNFDRDTIHHPSSNTRGWVQCPNCATAVAVRIEDGPDRSEVLRRLQAAVAEAWDRHDRNDCAGLRVVR